MNKVFQWYSHIYSMGGVTDILGWSSYVCSACIVLNLWRVRERETRLFRVCDIHMLVFVLNRGETDIRGQIFLVQLEPSLIHYCLWLHLHLHLLKARWILATAQQLSFGILCKLIWLKIRCKFFIDADTPSSSFFLYFPLPHSSFSSSFSYFCSFAVIIATQNTS